MTDYDLAKAAVGNDPAATVELYRLIEKSVKAVIAKHYPHVAGEYQDWVQEVWIVVQKKLNAGKYDATRSSLQNFVMVVAKSEIKSRHQASPIHLAPGGKLRDARRIHAIQERLEEELGRCASLSELADETGIEDHEALALLNATAPMTSLDAEIEFTDHDDVLEWADVIADPRAEAAFESVGDQAKVEWLMEVLDDEERELVTLVSGINGDDHSLREAAKTLGISHSSVKRRFEIAAKKLRDRYAEAEDNR